jgi:hypothetical protein
LQVSCGTDSTLTVTVVEAVCLVVLELSVTVAVTL